MSTPTTYAGAAAPTDGATALVRVRYFAAAAEAAGTPGEDVSLPARATAADLVAALSDAHGPELARVLGISSLLVDGVVRTDLTHPLGDGATSVDVLPPFAGG